MKKNIAWIFAVNLILFVFLSVAVVAQEQGAKVQKVTVKGKIQFMERFGGYYVESEDPPAQFFIVNQDKETLDKLMKSGKKVVIRGHLTSGADYLMIEKINGKKYSGKPSQ